MELSKRLSDKKKKAFYSQLYVLLHSGLSFSSSFSLLIESSKGSDRNIYEKILGRVVSGGCLWEAMEYVGGFDRIDCGVIRIGEESGKLMEALSFLSDYYDRRETQRRTLVSALSYPVITLAVAVVVLCFMLLVVVPMFEQVYSRMGGELPALTRFLMGVSSYVPSLFFAFVALVALLLVIRRVYGNTEKYQKLTSGFILHIPLVGGLLKKAELSRFCRIMCLLVSSDVPILSSLNLVGGILRLYPYRKAVWDSCVELEFGSMLCDAFSSYPDLFDKKFLVMLRVGEETGALDRMLKTLADDTSEELNYQVRQLNSTLEPLMVLLIGVVVGFVLIAMYLPMFKLGMTIQ